MDYTFLCSTPLFRGLNEEQLRSLLNKIEYKSNIFSKNETILFSGDRTDYLGIVISGYVTIETDDVWGNKNILSQAGPGELFAEVYALIKDAPIMVNVVAKDKSEILFVNCDSLLSHLTANDSDASIIIKNLLNITVHKNHHLSRKIFDTSPKSIRGRLLSYLSFESTRAGSNEFLINYDRQQLADYLNVDRSALSAELSKMRDEGYIEFKKNYFKLKQL